MGKGEGEKAAQANQAEAKRRGGQVTSVGPEGELGPEAKRALQIIGDPLAQVLALDKRCGDTGTQA